MPVDIKTEIVVLVVVAIGLGFLGVRWASRAALFRRREERTLSDLYRSFVFNVPVDMQTFIEMITLIGECYKVAPGKLRAEDRFDGILSKHDSWNLGGGAEDLQERLERGRSIQLPDDRRLHTVQDLIEYCAAGGSGRDGKGGTEKGTSLISGERVDRTTGPKTGQVRLSKDR